MDATAKLEQALTSALAPSQSPDCPPLLAEALSYSVFPGGARIRPKLLLSVAKACAATDMKAVFAGACAIEFLHCASLVHDDLPCFDGAAYRRGKPSVHVTYGERIAVLAGDALIVKAFETVADFPVLIRIIAQSAGAPHGIAAGQAWECEPRMDLVQYQRAKTGALFAACTQAGAAAAGLEHAAWRTLGLKIGEAFQVADDLRDVAGLSADIGKPTGQDAANNLPNMVSTLGYEGAQHYFDNLLSDVVEHIPPCPGRDTLAAQIVAVSQAMVAKVPVRSVA
jgi:geranylgeranyl diphosphate synthase, type II